MGSFKTATDAELLELVRRLFDAEGPAALSFDRLKRQGSLYFALYQRGIRQKEMLVRLGLTEEYQKYKRSIPLVRGGKTTERWTWDRVVEKATAIKTKEGFLPPAQWFQSNGQGSLVQAVYYLERSWEDLRSVIGDFDSSSFVESRTGIRWRSHPEASFSNFLYARGIEHKRGMKYPETYGQQATAGYAYYDLHFLSAQGEWIDVEIWGDKPGGHDEVHYRQKRADKERFNANNLRFLGVHFKDCFSEPKLTEILSPFVGVIEPFRFLKSTDPLIQTTHWSNADELLATCAALAETRPGGQFPPEDWLRKRGQHADREGPPYNTMSVYIKTWLGGVRNVRKLLGQSHVSTEQWDRDKALKAYHDFYRRHGMTTGQARHVRSGHTKEVRNEASRIEAAVIKYASGAASANRELGLSASKRSKWAGGNLLEEYRKVVSDWGLSPSQLRYDHEVGKRLLPRETYIHLGQIVDAATRIYGGTTKIHSIIGFAPPSRKKR